MYPSLIDFLCDKFGCDARRLKTVMQSPRNVRFAERLLEDKMVRTTYTKRTPRCFKPMGLTLRNAYQHDTYEGVKGIKVDVHYYCKYKIWLEFAALPLVQQDVGNGHVRLFPMELLTVAYTLTKPEPPFRYLPTATAAASSNNATTRSSVIV